MHRASPDGGKGLLCKIVAALVGCSAPAAAAIPGRCPSQVNDVVETRGAVVEDGSPGTFQRRVEVGSGRSIEKIDLGLIRQGSGFDGKGAWSQDVSGGVHDLNSGFARALSTSQAWLDAHQGCPPGGDADWTFIGPKVEGGRRVDAWRAKPAGGAPVELWYDPATRHLDRALLQQAETRLVRHFADWRTVDRGHVVAFSERDEYVEDESEVRFDVAAVRVKTAAAPDDFARPAAPRDATIRNRRNTTDVSYDDDHRTRIYVPVFLNGHGPLTFELDNGGHFILDADTAKAVGLSPAGAFSSTGAGNGVARVGFVRVKEVRIGDVIMVDQPAKVRAFSVNANDRGAQPPRAGILGLELFERFTVSIQRRRKRVTLRLRNAPYAQPAGRPVPLVFDEDAPLIEGAIQGRPAPLMLDTGNAGATIVEDFWAQKNGLAMQLGAGLFDGEVRYSTGTVTVGATTLAGETLRYDGPAERGSEYTRSVAAILGEPLLSRFDAVYDYAKNLVFLNEVPDIDVLPFDRSGLGLDKRKDGNFAVYSVLPASPAAQAGFKKGDIVSEIAGKPARLLSRADAGALFRQAPGSHVDLRIVTPRSRPGTIRITIRNLLGDKS